MAQQVKNRAQVSMEDKFLENPELEQQLEDRESARLEMVRAQKAFRKLDEVAKGYILEIAPTAEVRCGRFILSVRDRPARTVDSFETKAATLATIKVAK
jgi:hypothetical protein